MSGTDHPAPQRQPTSKLPKDQPKKVDQPTADLSGTDSPVSQQQVIGKFTTAPSRGQSAFSMDTDSDSDMSQWPEVSFFFVEEGELSNQDPDVTVTDPDQTLSEEQTYRETMRGIRSFMGWSHIPDMDTNHFIDRG